MTDIIVESIKFVGRAWKYRDLVLRERCVLPIRRSNHCGLKRRIEDRKVIWIHRLAGPQSRPTDGKIMSVR